MLDDLFKLTGSQFKKQIVGDYGHVECAIRAYLCEFFVADGAGVLVGVEPGVPAGSPLVPVRFAWLRSARLRSAWVRFAPLRSRP